MAASDTVAHPNRRVEAGIRLAEEWIARHEVDGVADRAGGIMRTLIAQIMDDADVVKAAQTERDAALALLEQAKAALPFWLSNDRIQADGSILAEKLDRVFATTPADALEAVKREAGAEALEDFAEKWAVQDGIEVLMFARDDVSAVQLTETALIARAAEYRKTPETGATTP